MSEWIGSISAQNRRDVAPSPRSINFYAGALVIARGPNVSWKRFGAGKNAGSLDQMGPDVLDLRHSVDTEQLGQDLRAIDGAAAQAMFDQARNSTAAQLAAAHPKNVLIAMDDLAGIHAEGMFPHAKLTITRTDGSSITLFSSARQPGFDARLRVLRTVLGDRFTTEKITPKG